MERPTIAAGLRRDGPPTTPRQSASVIVLRDDPDGLQLLLVRRNPAQRFMGGYWVFPGGSVDAGESHREAAVRELAEEAGIVDVDPRELVAYSRWITPEQIQTRFDTSFYVVRAPSDAHGQVDGQECVELRWSSAGAAVDAYGRGELALIFPTLRQLEALSAFGTAAELLEHARATDVRPTLPRVVHNGDEPRVLLPGEPGYAAD